ncbi:hypothetical protein CLV32_2989 [Pedobacter duraquae]|uniref:Uncharacterized protein n=2 Tax=Pedobacter duraquae TaxID=425511 RepID=A0A4R6IIT6_9SPHI|nr:hypothetical protein CLV32_2989 [Pedobacter duraquae]
MLLLLSLLPIFSKSQQPEAKPVKGTNVIYIKNDKSAAENYEVAAKTLLDNGFYIEQKDADFKTLKTQPRKINKSTYLYFLNIRATDHQIVIQGQFKTGIELSIGGVKDPDNYEQIKFRNISGYKLAFKSMENAALLFSMPLVFGEI